jgi:hypothetical protein
MVGTQTQDQEVAALFVRKEWATSNGWVGGGGYASC